MNLLDVNVLVAWALEGHPQHERVWAWWRESSARNEVFTIPGFVVAGFLRVGTNPVVQNPPLDFADAWDFLDDLSRQPTYASWSGTADVLSPLRVLTATGSVTPRLVSDAYIAACAIAVGGTLVTFDRGFRRFDGLRLHELC